MTNLKKIVIVLMLCSTLLFGCADDNIENKYFIKLDTQAEDLVSSCTIVYAKDTKVKYLIWESVYGAGITPLYNADGSLQIYEGE